jgi:hypothetical protein
VIGDQQDQDDPDPERRQGDGQQREEGADQVEDAVRTGAGEDA